MSVPVILSSGSMYLYGLERVFALAAATGYDGMEILIDDRWDTRDAAYLRRLSAAHDLPIHVLHSPFVPHVPGWPTDVLGRLERSLQLAQELNVPVVVSHLPFRLCGVVGNWVGREWHAFRFPIPWPHKSAYYDLLNEGRLAELEVETGVTVGVENMPSSARILGRPIDLYWFNTPQQLARFPHVTLDTTHLGTWGLDPLAVYEQLKARIVHVHLSNFDGQEHRLPFEGDLPLDDLLQTMSRDGYAGAVAVELSPDALEADDETRCRENLRRTLAFCRRHLGEREI